MIKRIREAVSAQVGLCWLGVVVYAVWVSFFHLPDGLESWLNNTASNTDNLITPYWFVEIIFIFLLLCFVSTLLGSLDLLINETGSIITAVAGGCFGLASLAYWIIGAFVLHKNYMPSHPAFVFCIVATLYLVPSFLALVREHRNGLSICILNVVLGWTVLGWVGAFIWSVISNDSDTSSAEEGSAPP